MPAYGADVSAADRAGERVLGSAREDVIYCRAKDGRKGVEGGGAADPGDFHEFESRIHQCDLIIARYYGGCMVMLPVLRIDGQGLSRELGD